MPVLRSSEHVARTSDFEVTHRNFEACSEFGELSDCLEPLLGDFRKDFVLLVHQVSIGDSV